MSNINSTSAASIASTNSVVAQLQNLNNINNKIVDIVEEYIIAQNETNSESVKKGLRNEYITLKEECANAFSNLPEEYKTKVAEKIDLWRTVVDTLSYSFEDSIYSFIEFNRSLYNELLAEAMNK